MADALERAVAEALARLERGDAVEDAWLRARFPVQFEAVREILDLRDALAATPQVSGRIGRYRVLSLLGAGAMGSVHEAEVVDSVAGLAPGDRVALKVVRQRLVGDPDALARFAREAALGQSIENPHVVRTYDAGRTEIDGAPVRYLAMELVRGPTVRDVIRSEAPADEPLCARVAEDVLLGLAALHEAGAVHRDVKPENLIVGPDGRVKISDLGIAHLYGKRRAASTGGGLGSVLYCAPEQFEGTGQLDARTDLYSLGLVLHELATGRHPFAGDSAAAVVRRRVAFVAGSLRILAPSLSESCAALVDRLLAPARADRPGSARHALAMLRSGVVPSPDTMLRRVEGPRLHGREAELAWLQDAFGETAGFEGAAVLVCGEAGIGKSTLLEKLRRVTAGRAAWLVASATGDATAGGGLLGAALAPVLERAPTEQLFPDAPRLARTLVALVQRDALAEDALRLDADALADALALLVTRLARRQPLVLALEDVHAVPVEDRARIARLADRLTRYPVLLVVTSRPGANLTAFDARFRRRELGGLDANAVVAMTAELLGSEPLGREIGERLARVVGGNPLHVRAAVDALRAAGRLVRAPSGVWRLVRRGDPLPIPETVAAAVDVRLAAADADERELLELAACGGRVFDPNVLAAAAGTNALDALRRLQRLARRTGIVRAAGRSFTFEHDLVRDRLRAGLTPAMRAAYHRAFGHAYESGGDVEEACE